MKTINEKIDHYLNEGYHPDIELERFEKNLINWFNEQDEIAGNEGATNAQIKLILTAKDNVVKALKGIKHRTGLVEKMMRKL